MKTFRGAAAAFLVLLPSILHAGEMKISLKDAISLALTNNNLVKAAELEEKAAIHGASASRSRYFPRLFLDESFTRSNSPTRVFMMKLDQGRFAQDDFLIGNLNDPSPTTDFRTALALEVPFFDPDIIYGTKMALSEAEGKGEAVGRRREDVALMTFSSYLEVQQRVAALKAAENAVIDAREHVRLTKVRSEAGTGLKSDELRALTFLAEMEQQEVTATNDALLAKMRLALVTGGKPGDVLDILEPVPAMPPAVKEEEILSLALKNRKDLGELKKDSAKADLAVRQATAAFWPTLYGSAVYHMNDRTAPFSRDNDAWLVGANLRWELFDGTRRFQERARMKALRDSAEEHLNLLSKEIAFQVRESLLRREEAVKRLQTAKAAYLYAEESVRLICKRFAGSLATMVEVLDAQTALNRARVNMVESESAYALAEARVWHAAGVFLEEVMK